MKLIKFFVVVIILISIVIGSVIAFYDPAEKAKKGQDEKLQTDAADFIEASVQYYSFKGGLPWFSEEENGAGCFQGGADLPAVPLSQMKDCLKALVEDSSLRDNAITPAAAKYLVVTNPSKKTQSRLDTVVCFQPQSKTWQNDPNTHYNIDGTEALANRCFSQGGAEYCYWCTQ